MRESRLQHDLQPLTLGPIAAAKEDRAGSSGQVGPRGGRPDPPYEASARVKRSRSRRTLDATSTNRGRTMGDLAGSRPSTNGLHYGNDWPSEPDVRISTPAGNLAIADASNGLCGGMASAVGDLLDPGSPATPDPNTQPEVRLRSTTSDESSVTSAG